MSTANVVSIGNELLTGHTVNTNAAWLCDKLLALSIPVISTYTIGDQLDSIARALKLAADDADIIIATGGLGPTDDDITRHAFAALLGTELTTDNDLLQRIRQFFETRNRKMPERNAIQACLPTGASPIQNDLGTAPGFFAESDNKLFVALPGVPSEMKDMFEKSVVPKLRSITPDQYVAVRRLNCFGTGESNIAEILGDLMARGRNPLINSTVHSGVITLHIIATAETKSKAGQIAESTAELIRSKLGKFVFGEGIRTLAEVVGDLLRSAGKTLAVAESCTAGLLAKLITDVPGASDYFTHGWITYSNQAKTSQLDIPADLIATHGAVSPQVAEAMAKAARRKAKTDFAIAVTGIAGPMGGSEQKPVGLVFITLCSDNNLQTERFVFSHDRYAIRRRATLTALNMLRLKLID